MNDDPPRQRTLTLVSRNGCHLCHEMGVALFPLANELNFRVEVLDVDSDPELVARYGANLPVLLHGNEELCQYFLEAAKVRDYLGKIC
ncbi:MAG: glutaredoxin family protein [Candidatus Accumulibacter sp.]|nr:glutaredoxin family protein [Accumulibacter sp.]